MKILSFILLMCLLSFQVIASDSCVTILTKNNIPRSRALSDCQRTVIVHRKQTGEREVVKDVPIYGAVKPDWMLQNTYDQLKKSCYMKSAEACNSGHSIGENGECLLPTYEDGKQIRISTKPIYGSAEECYKKKGIYGQRRSRKETSMEPVFENTTLTYEEIVTGDFSSIDEEGLEVANNLKGCMEILGNTPRNTQGMREHEIYNTPGRKQANPVFALCNIHSAKSVVENEGCYEEINANPNEYPLSANLNWYLSGKKGFCRNLMKLKDDLGFINCKNEVMTTTYQMNKNTRYLSFVPGDSPGSPDITGCLNHKNLKWFRNSSNLRKAKECSAKVISSIGSNVRSSDAATLLQNCYGGNWTNTCFALDDLRASDREDIFDLCGDGPTGMQKFKKSNMNSCRTNIDPSRMDEKLCQYRCLSFLIPQFGRSGAIDKCHNFRKYGAKEFQHCFYLVSNEYGGNLSKEDAMAFCPQSDSAISNQLNKGSRSGKNSSGATRE